MIDPDLINPRLAASFIAHARRAAESGGPVGSTSERIVAALLNGRADWLPAPYRHPLKAITRLHAGGPHWFHTMMAVSQYDWRDGVEMHHDEAP